MRRAIEIVTEDGCTLRGELHEAGDSWVVLAHGVGDDLDVWLPTALRLAADGFTVVAFDLRGHGGSEGEPDSRTTSPDLRSVCRYAEQHGARTVFVAAEGASIIDALDVAANGQCLALVLVGPPRIASHQATCPRLVIARSTDDDEQAALRVLRSGSGLVVAVHIPLGRDKSLLVGDWGSNVSEFIGLYFRDQRFAVGAGWPRTLAN